MVPPSPYSLVTGKGYTWPSSIVASSLKQLPTSYQENCGLFPVTISLLQFIAKPASYNRKPILLCRWLGVKT